MDPIQKERYYPKLEEEENTQAIESSLEELRSTIRPRPEQYQQSDSFNEMPWWRQDKKLLLVGGVSVGVVVIAVIGLFMSEKSTSSEKIPLIKADAGPVKVKPEQNESSVPYQDKQVYQKLSDQKGGLTSLPPKPELEKLLPKPEEPLPAPENEAVCLEDDEKQGFGDVPKETTTREMIKSPIGPSKSSVPVITPVTGEVEKVTQQHPVPKKIGGSSSTVTDGVPAEKLEKKEATSHISASGSKVVTDKKVVNPDIISGDKGFRVQIGAVESREHADKEWSRLRGAHKGLLDGVTHRVVRVDLGAGKGVWHRIQVGPFRNRDAASAFAKKLRNNNVSAIVVSS